MGGGLELDSRHVGTGERFDALIGDSAVLRQVLEQAELVAPTDATVLIQGETGTGKELVARAIHRLSARRDRAFVKLNCAAVPATLLENELFGHERGAFTDASAQTIGRFELADGGTLFLDEVGEIPLELQSKFLRVLQEQEFERLGGTRTIHVDIRLVAATNRDLAAMVADREFRSDLYYRLNVFPIVNPPLRERPEDVPVLARYFMDKFAARMQKRVTTIPSITLNALCKYRLAGQHSRARAPRRTRGHSVAWIDARDPARRAARQNRHRGAARGCDHTERCRARTHLAGVGRRQLDGRRAVGCCGAAWDQAHDAAVDDEQAWHRAAAASARSRGGPDRRVNAGIEKRP